MLNSCPELLSCLGLSFLRPQMPLETGMTYLHKSTDQRHCFKFCRKRKRKRFLRIYSTSQQEGLLLKASIEMEGAGQNFNVDLALCKDATSFLRIYSVSWYMIIEMALAKRKRWLPPSPHIHNTSKKGVCFLYREGKSLKVKAIPHIHFGGCTSKV